VHRLAGTLAAGLKRLGFAPESDTFFDTIVVDTPGDDNQDANSIHARAREAGINLRAVDASRIGIAIDECTGRSHIEAVWRAFAGAAEVGFSFAEAEAEAESAGGIPAGLRRASPILTHEIFNSHHSETEMLRYLRRLQARDVALDRSMIALGSCTMKLNATTEMIPVTWPEFAAIHPFAPAEQTRGYARLIAGLEAQLAAITGFAAVSLQPNAGSQGEFSGLLAIRRYHDKNGEAGRDICLIPSSAHGTNPASAVMAGMRVVVVACDENGNVDVASLKAKAAEHAGDLAALMITYPSTHGVFEESIVEICEIVHEAGGQVYMDGANLNALVGLCRPGEFGPDVAHLNLHKTFCVPHGGGGPGVGPIGVGAHLQPFLPGHRERPEVGAGGAVAAAPWGSAGILPISWAYIALMGASGLARATQVAILSANYMARRLAPHYPVLYTGPGGLVAHECIIDLRPLKESAGISVDDVAKRLMDYGFHAPTMSFPVAGTLMIEPTESEPKAELDRFCDAMIAIREEIRRVETGSWPAGDNPLVNAPHTAEDLTAEGWTHPYSREIAVFPAHWLHADKYWPPVGRIDQVYGDRHLVCSCPPMEAYLSAAE
jgi:glycine dehydrogenase